MPTPRTLTLAAQSLRVNSRAPSQWLARVAMASVALLALYVAWGSRGIRGAPGLWLFSWHAWTCLFLLAIGGAAFFPAAIAEEKEQRSLPLLRLAGCSPTAVLLGRATGDLLTVVGLLVAQLPIAVLAITLGGVAPVQVQAAGLLLLALVVFAHGVGVLSAVVCRTVARATGTAVVVVLDIDRAAAAVVERQRDRRACDRGRQPAAGPVRARHARRDPGQQLRGSGADAGGAGARSTRPAARRRGMGRLPVADRRRQRGRARHRGA